MVDGKIEWRSVDDVMLRERERELIYHDRSDMGKREELLTLVLPNPDIPCLCK